MQTILVTGGAGYIGSHTVVELLKNDYDVVIVDNFSNSKHEAVRRIEAISGKKVKLYVDDVRNKDGLRKIFTENKIDGVINFAGLKAVGESVKLPLKYYDCNICGFIALIEVMEEFNCKNFVFSSSATVYGDPETVPVDETAPLSTTNPYGSTKLFIEYMLKDLYKADNTWNIAILRYFNPIGAHPSGLIGEDPNGIPNNLCPYITKVAVGKLPYLNVFGNDYNTPDGTGVRDYIHVCDLAEGHVLAIKKLLTNSGLVIVNLGTGEGYSVLDMVKTFSKVLGRELPYKIAPRRAGDVAVNYANPQKAYEVLGFKAKRNLTDMARDALNWQTKNPDGYPED